MMSGTGFTQRLGPQVDVLQALLTNSAALRDWIDAVDKAVNERLDKLVQQGVDAEQHSRILGAKIDRLTQINERLLAAVSLLAKTPDPTDQTPFADSFAKVRIEGRSHGLRVTIGTDDLSPKP